MGGQMNEVLGYLTQKITSTIGGFFGVLSRFAYKKPKSMLDALMRGSLATMFSFIFAIPLLWYFGLPYTNWQWQLASGFVCGFLGYATLATFNKVFTRLFFNRFNLTNHLTRRSNARVSKKSPARRKKRTK